MPSPPIWWKALRMFPEDMTKEVQENNGNIPPLMKLERMRPVSMASVTDMITDPYNSVENDMESLANKTLRMPVERILKIKGIGDVIGGQVSEGVVKPGDEVNFIPTHTKCSPCTGKVVTVNMSTEQMNQGTPGQKVGLNIKGLDKENMPKVGDIMVLKTDTRLKQTSEFTANVRVTPYAKGEIKVGYSPVGYAGTGRAPCKITKLISKKSENGKLDVDPSFIQANDYAKVVFEPLLPFVVERRRESEALSRIAFGENTTPVMVGSVEEKEDTYPVKC